MCPVWDADTATELSRLSGCYTRNAQPLSLGLAAMQCSNGKASVARHVCRFVGPFSRVSTLQALLLRNGAAVCAINEHLSY